MSRRWRTWLKFDFHAGPGTPCTVKYLRISEDNRTRPTKIQAGQEGFKAATSRKSVQIKK